MESITCAVGVAVNLFAIGSGVRCSSVEKEVGPDGPDGRCRWWIGSSPAGPRVLSSRTAVPRLAPNVVSLRLLRLEFGLPPTLSCLLAQARCERRRGPPP